MRRMIIGLTALAVLVAATAAFAASSGNTYTAKLSFSPKAAGSKSHPVAVGQKLLYTAKGAPGRNAAPLIDIKTTVYGLAVNPKALPTCSIQKITAAQSDKSCPKRSLVASGSIEAKIGPTSLQGGFACDPLLHVYNGGGNTVVYFFVIAPGHVCGPVLTGAVPPYKGYYHTAGKNLILDVPLPPDASTNAGNLGLYGSLEKETLTWFKLSGKVGGKTVPYTASVACKAGKRPYAVKFTATDSSGKKQSKTITGSDKC